MSTSERNFARKFVRIIAVAMVLSISSCSKEEMAPSAPKPLPLQTLKADLKRCLDLKIDALRSEASRAEGPEAEDALEAVRSGFDRAASECGMDAQQRVLYLDYTNVTAGVLPDSVGDDTFTEGKVVIDTANLRRGTIQERFTNGWSLVKWDGDAWASTVKELGLAAQVRSRAGIAGLVELLNIRSFRKGVGVEVYSNGIAWVRWHGDLFNVMERISDLSPRVQCLRLCTGDHIIHNQSLRRGFITSLYANGRATVRWEGERWDATVNLSEVAGRQKN